MEFSDLQVFRAVVDAGGVVRAADALHRAQSSVTARIQALEERLGVELFLRQGRRLALSPAGRVLYGYAGRMLELAREAAGAMKADAPSGLLRLGAMESTAAVRLPKPLARFHELHPQVALELYSGDPRDLMNQVLAGELDAALVTGTIADKRLASLPVYEEELVIVAEAKHAPIHAPSDLASRAILTFHPGCPHRKRLEDWFARGRMVPGKVVEVSSYHLILGCVAIGMGVALLPLSVLEQYAGRERLSVHRLPGKLGRATTRLTWRKDAPQANIAALSQALTEEKPAQRRKSEARRVS